MAERKQVPRTEFLNSRRQFLRITKFQNSFKPFLSVFPDTCVKLSHDCLEAFLDLALGEMVFCTCFFCSYCESFKTVI